MYIQAEVFGSWQVIRISLNTSDDLDKGHSRCSFINRLVYLAEHDTKREDIDTFIIALTFEHLRCHLGGTGVRTTSAINRSFLPNTVNPLRYI
jgi:hypothetical protein